MKHIFKKLHHQPNRSNETPQPPPQQSPTSSASSDSRVTSSSSANAPTTASGVVGSTASYDASGDSNRLQQHQQQDYYSSEEEYQVQLALALSASSSGQVSALIDREKALIRSGGATDNGINAAEILSRRYWNYGVLDFEEKVVDGFYDLYNLSTDPAARGNMPSLMDLENNDGGSDYEVVVVSRKLDPALEELMQIAQCILLDCPSTEIGLVIQRLAELVTEHLGGPVPDANLILSKWMERSIELRTSLHTTVLPIGSLQVGLSRHRALLFKVLCDSAGIPCRLVKGNHYTGFEDDAVNIVKLQDDSECLVDLMGSPGTLIPIDFSADNTPLNSFNPQRSKLPILQTNKGSKVKVSSEEPDQNSNGGQHWSLGAVSEEPKAPHSIFDTSVGNRAGFSGLNEKLPSAKQLDNISSQAIGSSLYKGGSGTNGDGDGSKIKLNVVPYSSKSSEASRNLFSDLNPFQVKVSDKSMMKNNLANGAAKLQLPKNNIENSRLPAPVMWNNRNAPNEVSKRNDYDIAEGIFVDRQGCDNTNVPSVVSRSTNVQSKAFKISEKSFDSNRDVLPLSSNGFKFASGESKLSPCFEEASNLVNMETDHGDNVEVTPNEEPEAKDHTDNFTRLQDRNMQHRFIESSKKLRETEVAGCVLDLGAKYVATVIDDVGECEILWENLVIGERIGLGSYGEVYHAEWNDTEVAVKKFLDQDFSGAALDEFKREVRIMRRLRHPNIVLFMGAVTRPPNLSIVSEFLRRHVPCLAKVFMCSTMLAHLNQEIIISLQLNNLAMQTIGGIGYLIRRVRKARGGSLYRIIHRPHCQIDEERRIKMALDVAKGMNCLHTSTPTIVHRDLKSHNLLVDNNWNVKVCDFGLSRLKHNTFLSSKSTAGTPEWMAPEVLRNEPSNEKCDVYSFGVILWELATLKLPWSEMNPIQVVGAVGFQNRRLEIPKEVDPLVARIICECWQTEPNLRPSFAQLTEGLKHLQRLVVPSHVEHPTAMLPQQNSLNSTS